MLRARKKDVRIKPNRKLDKRSSRGMLYENEELRLRTIEINAEVERGQTDIKKLRRENDHLRREMWALRDEYERLEKLIKHLDLAGTGSEHHQRGHQHSDGEGRMGGDDDDDDDRGSPSVNGRNSNSEGSGDEGEADAAERSTASDGFPSAINRSKSQTVVPDFRHATAAPAASANCGSDVTACHCHEASLAAAPCCHHRMAGVGVTGAVYVECGNPDKDNIVNYQKAYGRMPRRCSSAGAKVYVATQHFHPHAPIHSNISESGTTDSSSRVCYESLTAVKGRYSTSGMEDEDGYAACSHPVRVDLRDFLHQDHTSSCANRSQAEMAAGLMPPTTPPPPVPGAASVTTASAAAQSATVTTAIHHPNRRVGEFSVEEDLVETIDEGGSSGVEGDDEPSTTIGGGGGLPPDTPSEEGDFNLDHLVNIVRSFQHEQELHQSHLVVVKCPDSPLTPTTPTNPAVLLEEAEDNAAADCPSSPEASGMATIKRRPPPVGQQKQPQRHRQIAIIERDTSSGGGVGVGGSCSQLLDSSGSAIYRTTRVVSSEPPPPLPPPPPPAVVEVNASGSTVTYAQPTLRTTMRSASATLRRGSFSSTSSSSSGSPTAIHSSTVVFLNNNNNNNNNANNVNNNNKKLGSSGAYAGNSRSETSLATGDCNGSSVQEGKMAVATASCTTTTIDGIVLTSARKGASPIRIVHTSPLPLPPPPPLSSASIQRSALEPTVVIASQSGSTRRRADLASDQQQPRQTNQQQPDGKNCLSLYPLPDGDASASLLRLHAVDPHTVSFDLKDLSAARSISVQEVIDQLEQQLDPSRCHVRGVRMLPGSVFFISLDSLRSLQYLMRHSFRLRGHRVRLMDVSAQTWIVSLTGVPHYISDQTVSLLLAAFGTIIGDVERRFFRGVDTGERLVRFRLKGHAKLPRHITVGGCRIQVRRMSPAPNGSASASASQRASADVSSAYGASNFHTFSSSGSGRRVRIDQSADVEHSDFAAGSTMPDAGASSSAVAAGAEAIYGTAATDSLKRSGPKIGRSFEYRSQLRVDLRMSAEVPVPPLDDDPAAQPASGTAVSTASLATGSRVTPTPSCPVCEQQPGPHTHCAQGNQQQQQQQQAHMRHQLTPPPPPLPPSLVIHRCRHHEAASGISPVGQGIPVVVSTTAASGDGRMHRESPPKSRASVNFDDTAAAQSGSRTTSGSGTFRQSNSKASASLSSNGILRKSVSGDEPSAEGGNDGANPAMGSADSGQGKGKNGVRMANTAAKKTARSFSLVDTFRVNKERRNKPVVRVETVIENASATNPEEGVRTLVVRRDSTESSSRSSRSSRKSNELPWCGCWGNGCL